MRLDIYKGTNLLQTYVLNNEGAAEFIPGALKEPIYRSVGNLVPANGQEFLEEIERRLANSTYIHCIMS